jgi:hypothetical protein
LNQGLYIPQEIISYYDLIQELIYG